MTSAPDSGAEPSRLVTELFPYDGGRRVTVYVPPDPPEAVVLAGDGPVLASWGPDLEGRGLPSTMIVAVHRAADEQSRLHEYSPGFDPQRFAAHEAFLVEEVRSWTAARFGVAPSPGRTAVLGVSAGAELALALAVRHPQHFGAVLCASPGAGFQPPADLPGPLPRGYFLAGSQEPFFLENATRWATAWGAAGADVVLQERAGSHGGPFWRSELPAMVAWAFAGQA